MRRLRYLNIILLCTFVLNTLGPFPSAQAGQSIVPTKALPAPGAMLTLSASSNPVLLRGVMVNPQHPLQLQFLVDHGEKIVNSVRITEQTNKLMKYFLTALTIPKEDFWVNLSPYEKNRIIDHGFGLTQMGEDMLAQDYILKQLTASLLYPESALGKRFWDEVYQKAAEKFGTTQVPVKSFNKVWVVPNEAVVHEEEGKAFIVKSSLKVMVEEDYLAWKHQDDRNPQSIDQLSNELLREIIIPVLEKEVNEGEHFALLRQMYDAFILADWYKESLRNSLLNAVYSNQGKSFGLEGADGQDIEGVYQLYITAFKKGVYNYVKEDIDTFSQQPVARKYFSGGMSLAGVHRTAPTSAQVSAAMVYEDRMALVEVNLLPHSIANELLKPLVEEKITSNDDLNTYRGIKSSSLKDEVKAKIKEAAERHTQEIDDSLLDKLLAQAPIIPIARMVNKLGQLGHVGLGQQYGEGVIYIEAQYKDNADVLAREFYQLLMAEQIFAKNHVSLQERRTWVKSHLEEARHWANTAPVIPDDLFKEQKARGNLPKLLVPSQSLDQGDINIAAKRESLEEERRRVFQEIRGVAIRRMPMYETHRISSKVLTNEALKGRPGAFVIAERLVVSEGKSFLRNEKKNVLKVQRESPEQASFVLKDFFAQQALYIAKFLEPDQRKVFKEFWEGIPKGAKSNIEQTILPSFESEIAVQHPNEDAIKALYFILSIAYFKLDGNRVVGGLEVFMNDGHILSAKALIDFPEEALKQLKVIDVGDVPAHGVEQIIEQLKSHLRVIKDEQIEWESLMKAVPKVKEIPYARTLELIKEENHFRQQYVFLGRKPLIPPMDTSGHLFDVVKAKGSLDQWYAVPSKYLDSLKDLNDSMSPTIDEVKERLLSSGVVTSMEMANRLVLPNARYVGMSWDSVQTTGVMIHHYFSFLLQQRPELQHDLLQIKSDPVVNPLIEVYKEGYFQDLEKKRGEALVSELRASMQPQDHVLNYIVALFQHRWQVEMNSDKEGKVSSEHLFSHQIIRQIINKYDLWNGLKEISDRISTINLTEAYIEETETKEEMFTRRIQWVLGRWDQAVDGELTVPNMLKKEPSLREIDLSESTDFNTLNQILKMIYLYNGDRADKTFLGRKPFIDLNIRFSLTDILQKRPYPLDSLREVCRVSQEPILKLFGPDVTSVTLTSQLAKLSDIALKGSTFDQKLKEGMILVDKEQDYQLFVIKELIEKIISLITPEDYSQYFGIIEKQMPRVLMTRLTKDFKQSKKGRIGLYLAISMFLHWTISGKETQLRQEVLERTPALKRLLEDLKLQNWIEERLKELPVSPDIDFGVSQTAKKAKQSFEQMVEAFGAHHRLYALSPEMLSAFRSTILSGLDEKQVETIRQESVKAGLVANIETARRLLLPNASYFSVADVNTVDIYHKILTGYSSLMILNNSEFREEFRKLLDRLPSGLGQQLGASVLRQLDDKIPVEVQEDVKLMHSLLKIIYASIQNDSYIDDRRVVEPLVQEVLNNKEVMAFMDKYDLTQGAIRLLMKSVIKEMDDNYIKGIEPPSEFVKRKIRWLLRDWDEWSNEPLTVKSLLSKDPELQAFLKSNHISDVVIKLIIVDLLANENGVRVRDILNRDTITTADIKFSLKELMDYKPYPLDQYEIHSTSEEFIKTVTSEDVVYLVDEMDIQDSFLEKRLKANGYGNALIKRGMIFVRKRDTLFQFIGEVVNSILYLLNKTDEVDYFGSIGNQFSEAFMNELIGIYKTKDERRSWTDHMIIALLTIQYLSKIDHGFLDNRSSAEKERDEQVLAKALKNSSSLRKLIDEIHFDDWIANILKNAPIFSESEEFFKKQELDDKDKVLIALRRWSNADGKVSKDKLSIKAGVAISALEALDIDKLVNEENDHRLSLRTGRPLLSLVDPQAPRLEITQKISLTERLSKRENMLFYILPQKLYDQLGFKSLIETVIITDINHPLAKQLINMGYMDEEQMKELMHKPVHLISDFVFDRNKMKSNFIPYYLMYLSNSQYGLGEEFVKDLQGALDHISPGDKVKLKQLDIPDSLVDQEIVMWWAMYIFRSIGKEQDFSANLPRSLLNIIIENDYFRRISDKYDLFNNFNKLLSNVVLIDLPYVKKIKDPQLKKLYLVVRNWDIDVDGNLTVERLAEKAGVSIELINRVKLQKLINDENHQSREKTLSSKRLIAFQPDIPAHIPKAEMIKYFYEQVAGYEKFYYLSIPTFDRLFPEESEINFTSLERFGVNRRILTLGNREVGDQVSRSDVYIFKNVESLDYIITKITSLFFDQMPLLMQEDLERAYEALPSVLVDKLVAVSGKEKIDAKKDVRLFMMYLFGSEVIRENYNERYKTIFNSFPLMDTILNHQAIRAVFEKYQVASNFKDVIERTVILDLSDAYVNGTETTREREERLITRVLRHWHPPINGRVSIEEIAKQSFLHVSTVAQYDIEQMIIKENERRMKEGLKRPLIAPQENLGEEKQRWMVLVYEEGATVKSKVWMALGSWDDTTDGPVRLDRLAARARVYPKDIEEMGMLKTLVNEENKERINSGGADDLLLLWQEDKPENDFVNLPKAKLVEAIFRDKMNSTDTVFGNIPKELGTELVDEWLMWREKLQQSAPDQREALYQGMRAGLIAKGASAGFVDEYMISGKVGTLVFNLGTAQSKAKLAVSFFKEIVSKAPAYFNDDLGKVYNALPSEVQIEALKFMTEFKVDNRNNPQAFLELYLHVIFHEFKNYPDLIKIQERWKALPSIKQFMARYRVIEGIENRLAQIKMLPLDKDMIKGEQLPEGQWYQKIVFALRFWDVKKDGEVDNERLLKRSGLTEAEFALIDRVYNINFMVNNENSLRLLERLGRHLLTYKPYSFIAQTPSNELVPRVLGAAYDNQTLYLYPRMVIDAVNEIKEEVKLVRIRELLRKKKLMTDKKVDALMVAGSSTLSTGGLFDVAAFIARRLMYMNPYYKEFHQFNENVLYKHISPLLGTHDIWSFLLAKAVIDEYRKRKGGSLNLNGEEEFLKVSAKLPEIKNIPQMNQIIEKYDLVNGIIKVMEDVVVYHPTQEFLNGTETASAQRLRLIDEALRRWHPVKKGIVSLEELRKESGQEDLTQEEMQGFVKKENDLRYKEGERQAPLSVQLPEIKKEVVKLPEAPRPPPAVVLPTVFTQTPQELTAIPTDYVYRLFQKRQPLREIYQIPEVVMAIIRGWKSPEGEHIVVQGSTDNQKLALMEGNITDQSIDRLVNLDALLLSDEKPESHRLSIIKVLMSRLWSDPTLQRDLVAARRGVSVRSTVHDFDNNWWPIFLSIAVDKSLDNPGKTLQEIMPEKYSTLLKDYPTIEEVMRKYHLLDNLIKVMREIVVIPYNYNNLTVEETKQGRQLRVMKEEIRQWVNNRDGEFSLEGLAVKLSLSVDALLRTGIDWVRLIKEENRLRIFERMGREALAIPILEEEKPRSTGLGLLLEEVPAGEYRIEQLRDYLKSPQLTYPQAIALIGAENLRRIDEGRNDFLEIKLSSTEWEHIPKDIRRKVWLEVSRLHQVPVHKINREKHLRAGKVMVEGNLFDPKDLNHYYYLKMSKGGDRNILSPDSTEGKGVNRINYILADLGLIGPQVYKEGDSLKGRTEWQRIQEMVRILGVKRVYVDLDDTVFWPQGWVGSEDWLSFRNKIGKPAYWEMSQVETRLIKSGLIVSTDPHAVEVIKQLQDQEVEVIGLTARVAFRSKHRVGEILRQMGVKMPVSYVGRHAPLAKAQRIIKLEQVRKDIDKEDLSKTAVLYIDNDHRSVLAAVDRGIKQETGLKDFHVGFYESNRPEQWKSTAYYFKETERYIKKREYPKAREALINVLELMQDPQLSLEERVEQLSQIVVYIDQMMIDVSVDKSVNDVLPVFLREAGHLMHDINSQELPSEIRAKWLPLAEHFFKYFFPHNAKHMMSYYADGLLVIREQKTRMQETRYYFEVNEENLFAFLEPILKFILKERLDQVILIDSGARPMKWAIDAFIAQQGLNTKVDLLPLSVKTNQDSLKSTKHWFSLAELLVKGQLNLETLNKMDRETVKAFSKILPAGKKILLVDDNVVSGDTFNIARQSIPLAGVDKIYAAALWNYRDGVIARNQMMATYQVPGQFNWWHKLPVDIKTVWEDDMTLRGVKERSWGQRSPKGEDLTPQSDNGEFERFEKFRKSLIDNLNMNLERYAVFVKEGVAGIEPIYDRGTGIAHDNDLEMRLMENYGVSAAQISFLPAQDFTLNINGRFLRFEQIKSLDQLRTYIKRPSARVQDKLADQLLYSDLAVYLIKDEKGASIGAMELVMARNAVSRGERNLIIEYFDLDYTKDDAGFDWHLLMEELIKGLIPLQEGLGATSILVSTASWEFSQRPEIAAIIRPERRLLYKANPLLRSAHYPDELTSTVDHLSHGRLSGVDSLLQRLKILTEDDYYKTVLGEDLLQVYRYGLEDIAKKEPPLALWARLLRYRFNSLSHNKFIILSRKPSERNIKALAKTLDKINSIDEYTLLDEQEKTAIETMKKYISFGVKLSFMQSLFLERLLQRQSFFKGLVKVVKPWQEYFIGLGRPNYQWSVDEKMRYQVLEYYHRKIDIDDDDEEIPATRFPKNFFKGQKGFARSMILIRFVFQSKGVNDLRRINSRFFFDNGLGSMWQYAFHRSMLRVAQLLYPGQYEDQLDDDGRLIPKPLTYDELTAVMKGQVFVVPGRAFEVEGMRIEVTADPNHGVLIMEYNLKESREIPFRIWAQAREGKPFQLINPFIWDLHQMQEGRLQEVRPAGHQWSYQEGKVSIHQETGQGTVIFVNGGEEIRFNIPKAVIQRFKLQDQDRIVGTTKRDANHPQSMVLQISRLKQGENENNPEALFAFGIVNGRWQIIDLARWDLVSFLNGQGTLTNQERAYQGRLSKAGDQWQLIVQQETAHHPRHAFTLDAKALTRLQAAGIVVNEETIVFASVDKHKEYGVYVRLFVYDDRGHEAVIASYAPQEEALWRSIPVDFDQLAFIDYAYGRRTVQGHYIQAPDIIEFKSDQTSAVTFDVREHGRVTTVNIPIQLRNKNIVCVLGVDQQTGQIVYKVHELDKWEKAPNRLPDALLVRDSEEHLYTSIDEAITDEMRQEFERLMKEAQMFELVVDNEGKLHPYILRYIQEVFPGKYSLEKLGFLLAHWLDDNAIPLIEAVQVRKKNGNGETAEELNHTERLFHDVREKPRAMAPLSPSEAKIKYLTQVYVDKYIHLLNMDAIRTMAVLRQLRDESDTPRKEAYEATMKYFQSLLDEPVEGIHHRVVDALGRAKEFYYFQTAAVMFIRNHKSAMIADEMGTGKTVETIAGVLNLPRVKDARSNRVVAVVPKSAIDVWKQEIMTWAKEDHPVFIMDGRSDEGRLYRGKNDLQGKMGVINDFINITQEADTPVGFVLMTFESMRGSFEDVLNDIKMLIMADGSKEDMPEFIKNSKGLNNFYQLPKAELLRTLQQVIGDERWARISNGIEASINKHLGAFYGVNEMAPEIMIVDEAHRMRNTDSLQTKALMAFKRAPHKILASGSPLRGRNAKKIWSLLYWLAPEDYPSSRRLMSKFTDTPEGRWRLGMHLRDTIMLRRNVATVLKGILPRLIRERRALSEGEEMQREYDAMAGNFKAWLEERMNRGTLPNEGIILGQINRLVQFTSGVRFIKSADKNKIEGVFDSNEETNVKLKELSILVKARKKGQQMVVFSQFSTVTRGLKEYYEKLGLRVSYFDGSLSENERAEAVKKFQNKETDLFISTDAGEESITLTAADIIVNYSLDWDLPDQRIKRIHRLSQDKPVTVIDLYLEGTIEERIYEIHAIKEQAHTEIIDVVPPRQISDDLRAIIEREFNLKLPLRVVESMTSIPEQSPAQTSTELFKRGGIDFGVLKRTVTDNSHAGVYMPIDEQLLKDDLNGLVALVVRVSDKVDLRSIFAGLNQESLQP